MSMKQIAPIDLEAKKHASKLEKQESMSAGHCQPRAPFKSASNNVHKCEI